MFDLVFFSSLVYKLERCGFVPTMCCRQAGGGIEPLSCATKLDFSSLPPFEKREQSSTGIGGMRTFLQIISTFPCISKFAFSGGCGMVGGVQVRMVLVMPPITCQHPLLQLSPPDNIGFYQRTRMTASSIFKTPYPMEFVFGHCVRCAASAWVCAPHAFAFSGAPSARASPFWGITRPLSAKCTSW